MSLIYSASSFVMMMLVLVICCCPFITEAHIEETAQQTTNPLRCWVGNSNPSSGIGWPPVKKDCIPYDSNPAVCGVTYYAPSRVYNFLCRNTWTCSQLKGPVDDPSRDSFYEMVRCCNTTGCNAIDPMPRGTIMDDDDDDDQTSGGSSTRSSEGRLKRSPFQRVGLFTLEVTLYALFLFHSFC